MTDMEEQPGLLDATSEPLTNFDRLAAALPEDSLAAKLLDAWRSAGVNAGTERMLAVVQPVHPKPTDDADAPVD